MFREIREIKKEEDLRRKETPGYLRIKPEKEISDEECNEFIAAIFAQAAAEAAGGEV